MAKFQPGNPGKPKGAKHKKKVLKINDFLTRENVDVAKEWWTAIQAIKDPKDKSDAINQFYKFVGAPPKQEVAEEPIVEQTEAADILSIVKTNDSK